MNRLWVSVPACFVALKWYDNEQIKQLHTHLNEELRVYREQVLSVNDFNRKVTFYIENTRYSQQEFNDYVQPLLDMAAVDYDMFLVAKDVDNVKINFQNGIKQENEKPVVKQRTWMEYFFPKPVEPQLPGLARKKYDPENAQIAMGPMAWRLMLHQIQEPLPSVLPKLGYVPHQDLTGWSFIPRRMLLWFFYRFRAQEISKSVLSIIKEQERQMTEDDLLLGSDVFVPYKLDKEQEVTPIVQLKLDASTIPSPDVSKFKLYSP
ncbi:hypothetical protein EDD86DRAFT_213590 [Gorgonomyces haynaldii]|nr:hypothetical protein EDD86DRAFT_213590 [Gorgonomyces haynaldii]